MSDQSKEEASNSSATNERNAFSNSTYVMTLWEISWQKTVVVSIFMLVVLVTVIGNTLVILSVLTTRNLRTVTNCYVMNLAITDWLVGTCVMPPSILVYIFGSWKYGWILCNIWISLDVLLCTASILSLCAISLDRYLAVIQPLKYSKKRRSKGLALLMILVVWIFAFLITCPPIFGWYNPDGKKRYVVECRYNQNKGYVIFSAMGSFFIPLGVMVYVYLKIGLVLNSRKQRMVRDAISERSHVSRSQQTSFVLENEQNYYPVPKRSMLKQSKSNNTRESDPLEQVSFNEPVEPAEYSPTKECSSIHNNCGHPQTNESFEENFRTFLENCLSKFKEGCGRNRNESMHRTSMYQEPSIHVTMRVSMNMRETKTAKTLTTVMGGFIACWLPFFCCYILKPFLPPKAISEGIMYFFTWVGWINCGINPFIYAFYNPEFRGAFWRLTFQNIRLCNRGS